MPQPCVIAGVDKGIPGISSQSRSTHQAKAVDHLRVCDDVQAGCLGKEQVVPNVLYCVANPTPPPQTGMKRPVGDPAADVTHISKLKADVKTYERDSFVTTSKFFQHFLNTQFAFSYMVPIAFDKLHFLRRLIPCSTSSFQSRLDSPPETSIILHQQ
jgi:hypothetical protein